jgi:hypothetical protein
MEFDVLDWSHIRAVLRSCFLFQKVAAADVRVFLDRTVSGAQTRCYEGAFQPSCGSVWQEVESVYFRAGVRRIYRVAFRILSELNDFFDIRCRQ